MSGQTSGEKTEKASAKKKKDARKKGEVHKSADLSSAVMLFVLFGTLKIGYEGFIVSLGDFMRERLSSGIADSVDRVTGSLVVADFKSTLLTVIPTVLPLAAAAMVCGVLMDVLQTGPLFVSGKLKPDFKKLNPLQGFKRMFSVNSLIVLFKSIIKTVIMAFIVYRYYQNNVEYFTKLMYISPGEAFSKVLSICFSMGITIALALAGFALLDAVYQWWKYEKDLRMTKQEVKDEYKQVEGNPQIKGRLRQKQRKMSAMRMMKHLPEATVVVTNPDHYAVALRYRENVDKAPVVVAKGQDYLALRIKDTAKKYDISIVENKPVARALYASCEIGQEIPPEMYQAIADILIYVYKILKHGER